MTAISIRAATVRGRIRAPPSKSYTHRAMVAAFLAEAPCRVVGPLDSDDTRATLDGLHVLGATVRRARNEWIIAPRRRGERRSAGPVRCAESGTTLRLLTALAALRPATTRFIGAPGLAARPMGELYRAIRTLGASVTAPASVRSLPSEVHGPINAGVVSVRGDESSQFTSALLMVLPRLRGRSEIRIEGRVVSRPYVNATCAVLRERGLRFRRSHGGFVVRGPQTYSASPIHIPGDASSAAYLWAAAAATGGSVEVSGVPLAVPQADLALLPILESMGGKVRRSSRGLRVTGPLTEPIFADFTDCPDLFPLVSVLAALVPHRTSQLTGATHLGLKESDRRLGSARIARALGARVKVTRSCVEIRGPPTVRALNCPSLGDHRLVMSAAVAGLATHGTSRVGRMEAVSKSFPGFWKAVDALTAGVGVET